MGGICMLAFVGTLISTVVIAVMMWLLGVIRLSYGISFFHSSLFGAIISATDPVTVLAVFGRLRANRDLNALVFGESVMNDAVAVRSGSLALCTLGLFLNEWPKLCDL
jgi:solute carrier family 9 (sodium/hydrogen exchanger), member 8